jgi:hypothetical protein
MVECVDPTHKIIKLQIMMCLRNVVFYMGNEYRTSRHHCPWRVRWVVEGDD